MRGTISTPPTGSPSSTVAEANDRRIAQPADKIEYARLLKIRGESFGQIAIKTGIPKTSRHRCLVPAGRHLSIMTGQMPYVASAAK